MADNSTIQWIYPSQIEVWKRETGNNIKWPFTYNHYSISKSPYRKMAKALSNSTRNLRKRLSFVHHKLAIPKKPKTDFIRNERKRIEDRWSTQTTTTKHQNVQNVFDDIIRLNEYPENSIYQTSAPRTIKETLDLPTRNGHISRSRTFRNDKTTGSLTFSEKRTSQYVLLTDHTPSS